MPKAEQHRAHLETQDVQRRFFYPTINEGVTILASTQEEADKKALAIKAVGNPLPSRP